MDTTVAPSKEKSVGGRLPAACLAAGHPRPGDTAVPRRGTAGDRHQVILHVEGEALRGEAATAFVQTVSGQAAPSDTALRDTAPADAAQTVLDGGPYVSAETSQRLACDASRVVMRHAADGSVLDVGRKIRTIPPAIRRALAVRDAHCRFPACTGRHTDAHHLEHWADGGATRLDNLVLLCRRHHRAVHEGGWTVTRGADGDIWFTRPNGQRLETAPVAPAWRGATGPRGEQDASPLAPTAARLAASGIVVGPETGLPFWYGERFDVGWAIDVLRQDEERERRARYVAAETCALNARSIGSG